MRADRFEQENAALRKRVQELEEALRPFAEIASTHAFRRYFEDAPEDEPVTAPAGAFRRARRALEQKP